MVSPAGVEVVIATPFYEGRGFAPFISSLVATARELTRAGIEWDFWTLSGHAYVDDARNEIATRFLETKAQRLIFIDSDMSWDVEGFMRLMTADAEIVGGSYPVKNAWDRWTCMEMRSEDGYCLGRARADGGGHLLRAEIVSGGFLKIERTALEKLAPHVKRYRTGLVGSDASPDAPEWLGFFTREHPHGEDISFCNRWKAIGGELWIEPQIEFGHTGQQTWTGNFDTSLRSRVQAQDALARMDFANFFG